MLECEIVFSFDDATYFVAWSHSFILFVQVRVASVVLQCFVRFISACHMLVHCLLVDKDHCVAIAYFLDFVPTASKEIAKGSCCSRRGGNFVKCFEVNVMEHLLHFVCI